MAALAPELQRALDLITEGCALIAQHSTGLTEEAKQLKPAIVLLQHATSIIASQPEAGQSATLRWKIYQLIQAQQSEDSCFYKELRCPVHLGLCGEVSDPVTLPGCGHSYCRTCVAPIMAGANPRCPQCRAPITAPLDQLRTNIAIKAVVDRLLPQQPVGAASAAAGGTVAGGGGGAGGGGP